MARRIPGKEEFAETLRYFGRQAGINKVDLRLGQPATASELADGGFDEIVVATGVLPRKLAIDGIDGPNVLSYVDVLLHGRSVGDRVALIGAGGIGFDVAEFLCHDHGSGAAVDSTEEFMRAWGVDMSLSRRGGLALEGGAVRASRRQIYLLQRKATPPGRDLGKTTGWIHRTELKRRGVQMIAGVNYERIDAAGLHITTQAGPRLLEVDTIVVCAGQEPLAVLAGELAAVGRKAHVIGGAKLAAELDARRAIDEGARLAASF
jgi:2,4-dienoyl-CoA reductase (NADPH2)